MNILLTGATGFLGRGLSNFLHSRSTFHLTAAVRKYAQLPVDNIVELSGFDAHTDWSEALTQQQVVIHAAARAHIMKDEVSDPLSEYRRVNVEGTLNLARQAAAAGVKRFIFISSIKVNGERTTPGKPFTADSTPSPEDAYGISKWEAELGLQMLAAEDDMELVVIRPPLIYGPAVKGNFASLISLVKKGLPLPLGAVKNKRSLVALDNLVDLIHVCITHPEAANQVFLAADGDDLSTAELFRMVAGAMGLPARLLPVPVSILILGATLLGKKDQASRVLGSLQVDIDKTRELLGWQPPLTVSEGMLRCVSDL